MSDGVFKNQQVGEFPPSSPFLLLFSYYINRLVQYGIGMGSQKKEREKSSAPKFSGGLYLGAVGHERDKNHSTVPLLFNISIILSMQMEQLVSVKAIRTDIHVRL